MIYIWNIIPLQYGTKGTEGTSIPSRDQLEDYCCSPDEKGGCNGLGNNLYIWLIWHLRYKKILKNKSWNFFSEEEANTQMTKWPSQNQPES